MAAPVGPLAQVKLPSGPSPVTAEQRYWMSFKNQLQISSPTSYPVTHVSAASNGGHFAVTTGTRVQIYSTRTRKLEKTVTRFADVARSGDLRRDGKVLVAGEDTGRLQVFDINSRAVLRTWMTHKQPVWATRFSRTHLTTLLSASDDKTVRLWDLPSNDPTHTFIGHQDYVRSADFIPASAANLLVSGSYDATVRLWDPRVPPDQPVMTFKHAAPVEDVLPLPSGTTLLAAAGPAISVLDLVAARPVRQIINHQKTVTSLCLASSGTRLVSGSLDGHVKVFETTGWNVVSTTKYQSPILTVRVLGTSSESPTTPGDSSSSSTSDRHLLVGMQSGVLSIRTRLTGTEAIRQRERDREMAALLAGTLDAHDARVEKRKRRIAASRRLDMAGEGADVVIADEPRDDGGRRRSRKAEALWQRDLRHGRYALALDRLLDPGSVAEQDAGRKKGGHKKGGKDSSSTGGSASAEPAPPLEVLTLLLALRHRSAMRVALEGRDERTVQPVLRWVSAHIVDPRYVGVCVEVAMHLIELYAEYVGGSAELAAGFRTLRRRVTGEVEKAKVACETGGMVEGLVLGAV